MIAIYLLLHDTYYIIYVYFFSCDGLYIIYMYVSHFFHWISVKNM